MDRIAEHDLMDTAEQAEAYAETDFSEAHDAFVSYYRTRFPDFSEGDALDLGCGTADVIIRFARAYPETRITGIDGAQAMLDIGLRDVELKGYSRRIRLQKCLLPDNKLQAIKFDALISNSLLHHLADPLVIWETLKHCAKPGAPVFIMDLMRPDRIETAKDLVELHAADAPDILKKDFYSSLLAAYTTEEVRQQLKEANIYNLTIEIVSDRHLIVWGRNNE
ncbi:MAG TPA: class I SAM-dependent methyltransferase [Nitrospirae bacterium]|nr:class I SAM-dependent methyltransferase [Nitrospirota bacterium]